MSITTTRELKQGDIIEIAQYNEHGWMNLRRVQVAELSFDRLRRRYRIIGVNMKGENPISYRLPVEPSEQFHDRPNSVEWAYFNEVEEVDE